MTQDRSPWSAGSLRGRGLERLLFGSMYEDAAVEDAVVPRRCEVFAVGSAGDTALTLAAGDRRVVAVDVNRAQVGYLRQRLAGGPRRRGTAEALLGLARWLAPAAGWTRGRVRRFLGLTDLAEQCRMFDEVLDTARFRLLLDTALAPAALLRVYRPEFVEVAPTGFGQVLRSRLRRGVATHPNRRNPYARLLFLGEPPAVPRPPPDHLEIVHDDAVAYLERQPAGRFSGFALSNILDGPDPAFRARFARAVSRAGTADATVVLRTFREPSCRDAASWATRDRSMIWGGIAVLPAARFSDHVRTLS